MLKSLSFKYTLKHNSLRSQIKDIFFLSLNLENHTVCICIKKWINMAERHFMERDTDVCGNIVFLTWNISLEKAQMYFYP